MDPSFMNPPPRFADVDVQAVSTPVANSSAHLNGSRVLDLALSPAAAYTLGAGDGSPNDSRNYMLRQRAEYLRNQRQMGGTYTKTHILTDIAGNVTALKTVLNRSIRDIAGRVLDVIIKEFGQHPQVAFELIDHNINNRFTFDPPFKEGYIKNYLQDALSWSRYQWRSHWKRTWERHPQCPPKRFPTLVAQWTIEASIMESKRMTLARSRRGSVQRNSDTGETSGMGGVTEISNAGAQVCEIDIRP